jgi:hypothetical protein
MFLNIAVGISTFITNFNTIVSTSRDWFRRVGVSACGWRIVFPHSRGTAYVSVWSETLRQSSNAVCARSQHCLLLLRYVFKVTVPFGVISYFNWRVTFPFSVSRCSVSCSSPAQVPLTVHSSSTGCQLLHNSPCSTLLLTRVAQLV